MMEDNIFKNISWSYTQYIIIKYYDNIVKIKNYFKNLEGIELESN